MLYFVSKGRLDGDPEPITLPGIGAWFKDEPRAVLDEVGDMLKRSKNFVQITEKDYQAAITKWVASLAPPKAAPKVEPPKTTPSKSSPSKPSTPSTPSKEK